jgi:hypothetical protein
MKRFKVTYKSETHRIRDKVSNDQWVGNFLTYQRGQKYVDHEGKLAYVVINEVETLQGYYKALTLEAVQKAFEGRTIDCHGVQERKEFDVKIDFIEEFKTNPFECLADPKTYCIGESRIFDKTLNIEDVGETIIVMENQDGYDEMSDEEKDVYLNNSITVEDTHTYLGC